MEKPITFEDIMENPEKIVIIVNETKELTQEHHRKTQGKEG